MSARGRVLRFTLAALVLAAIHDTPAAAAPGALAAVPRPFAFAAACARPAALRFDRRLGHTVGTLRWRASPHAVRGLRYRVLRDGRIVGQTAAHAIRIPVALGRTHRFAVVPLGPAGPRRACAARLRKRIAYRPPGAPRDVAVTGDERSLQLTWSPGARGDGRLAGYRLLRDGAVVGQTRKTIWTLPASANRGYRFALVAVDRAGHTSAPSATVTAVTGHRPPSPPGAPQALAISDAAIGAQWQPSAVDGGRIVGYRVLRDGVVVAQVKGTSAVLEHLAPSTAYAVAVVAVDSLGYVSAPADAGTVATQDPVPTDGRAHAYLLASTDQSFADFRAHYRALGVLYPTYFDCTSGDGLEGRDDPLVTRWAQAREVRVLPRVNCQRSGVIHRILTDAATRAQWLDRLTGLVEQDGYDGISLDFEAGPASDRAALTSFVAALAGRLHDDGRLLTVAVSPKTSDSLTHPRSGIFDYPKLAQSADWLFVMAWGLHWSTSAPGAQDDATWTRQVADYVATLAARRKFVYGTNLYAMDWPAGGGPSHPATAYEHDDIVPRLPALGASVALDPTADSYHASYRDAGGVAHDVWYPDAVTISRRIRLAQRDGLGAVGFWRLGREDQSLWEDPLLAPGAAW